MRDHLRRISQLSEHHVLWADDFERLISQALEEEMPFSVLRNVILFRADKFETCEQDSYAMAYEIDNLFHYRQAAVDYVVIVEAKNQPVKVRRNKWGIEYRDKKTGKVKHDDARRQLKKHVKAIRRYLRPLAPGVELRIKALVVSSDRATPRLFPREDSPDWFGLCSYQHLSEWMQSIKAVQGNSLPEFLRVSQSEFLAKLRLGVPAPSLGHPELRHAINYIGRCRREIDNELFRSFEPSRGRWAISGAAGTGKSVMLAYSAAVFASGHEIDDSGSDLKLVSHEKRESDLGLPVQNARNICIMALKSKQLVILERLYAAFVQQFNELHERENGGKLNFLKPRFAVWNDAMDVPPGSNLLLVDEAHDLSEKGQAVIRRWYEGSTTNYLVLACDRHQKIRLMGSDAAILEGVSFKGFSVRLSRNYRNPFPIYAASLAIMFRWFAGAGPKVMPTNQQLHDWLGFDLETIPAGNSTFLKMRNDSHPGNAWSHSVGEFDSCTAAHEHLTQQNLDKDEVLWVRFSAEDPDFDYERLSKFTYHNFFSAESADLVDKYVKGQEFPIVVVEGFPEEMDESGTWQDDSRLMDAAECRMWNIRRQIYLCASRATGFLYFICNQPRTQAIQRIEGELGELIRTLAVPMDPKALSGKEWRMVLKSSGQTRNLVEYDLYAPESQRRATDKRKNRLSPTTRRTRGDSFTLKKRPTVATLASLVSQKAAQVIRDLNGTENVTKVNDVVSPENARRVARKYDVTLNFSAQALAETGIDILKPTGTAS